MPTTRHDIGYHGTLDIKANAIIEQNYFIQVVRIPNGSVRECTFLLISNML